MITRFETTYAAAARRIRDAKTLDQFKRMDQMIDRLYSNDLISVREFMRLDSLIIDRQIALED